MTGKVSVQSFISRYQFIRKGQSWKKWAFFKPEDGTKWSRKENSLNCCKSYQPFMEGSIPVHPFHRPLCLLPHNVDVCNCGKEIIFLIGVFDVCINKQRIGLRMNVLHSYLKSIEAPSFWDLHFSAKLFSKVFKDYPITGREKGQNVFDEMLFFFIELLPILEILIEVDLISSPKRSQVLLVHLENRMILYGEKDEPLLVFFENWLLDLWHSEGSEWGHDWVS